MIKLTKTFLQIFQNFLLQQLISIQLLQEMLKKENYLYLMLTLFDMVDAQLSPHQYCHGITLLINFLILIFTKILRNDLKRLITNKFLETY